MTILDDLWLAAVINEYDATPVDLDTPDYEAMGADDYRQYAMYMPPRGISQEQLDLYRAGFEAAEAEDTRQEIEWVRGGC